MLKVSATKGIWTLDEVIKMLQDANIPFKAVIGNDPNFAHEVKEDQSVTELPLPFGKLYDFNRKQA